MRLLWRKLLANVRRKHVSFQTMLPGKGKHGFKRSGKGGKDIGKLAQSTSKAKDLPVAKTKLKDLDLLDDKDGGILASLPLFKTSDNTRMLPRYTAGNMFTV